MEVQNQFPKIASNQRIALIGEHPLKDDVISREPFTGTSGRFLSALLSRAGINRQQCFLGHVCQLHPPNNKIESFSWTGYEIQSGIEQLKKDLCEYKPNIVVLLGNLPLKLAKDSESNHPLHPKRYLYKNSNWRGSLFLSDQLLASSKQKCLSTYPPDYALRKDYSVTPLLQFDLKRAVEESLSPELVLPQRQLAVSLTLEQTLERLHSLRNVRTPIALDIEGYVFRMSCISFATSATDAFIVPFMHDDGSHYWHEEDEWRLMRALRAVLEDPLVPKVLQNCLYDTFVLHYSYNICIRNVVDDTMIKSWSLYCELEKGLATIASLYTKEPFYKSDGKSSDDTTFYTYCCKDSAVTHEINTYLEPRIKSVAREHYKFNMNMLLPVRYMEIRGIRYDVAKAKTRRDILATKLHEAQAKLNALCGFGFDWKSKAAIVEHMQRVMCYKKDVTKPKADYVESYARFEELWHQPLSLANIGEIEDLCEVSLNVNSKTQFIPYLYETLKLPTQWNDNKENPSPTADYEALLNLSKYCLQSEQPDKHEIIQRVIEIRALSTREGMLSISADNDGRIRCGYNIVGSETGRITCYTSPTGSGYNLQTIPKYTTEAEAPGGILGDRDLFLADEGHYLFQCDLSGADGWTVAAYAKMLGDSTMLDDYNNGNKPAKILALMVRGVKIDYKDPDAIREAGRAVSGDDWDYFACKRVQHGASYLEGPITIGRNILTDSEGKLFMSVTECRQLRDLFFSRYPGILKWHQWVGRQISQRPVLTAASGQTRIFFGRSDEILTKAVAHEPQANTTYATNKAMWRLWTDRDNRTDKDGMSILRIEPLHQVHDALIGQFKVEDTDWAVVKIKSYFDNPLAIAGQQITIPFEGGYGASWGELKKGKI